MSFAEWTATSIRPSSNASSISFTKTPREPISPNGFVRSLSPAVVIGTSAISIPSPRKRSAASSAWVSARRLPLLPIRMRVKAEEVTDGVRVSRAVRTGGRLLQPHRRVVQQLVDDLDGHSLDGAPLLGREVGQAPLRAVELAQADLLGPRAQRGDRRYDAARSLPRPEALGLLGDDRLGASGGGLPCPGADGLVEVVDVIEERVRQRRDLRVEVPGHREVDEK